MAKIFFSYIPPLAKQNRRKRFGRKYREERSKEELDQWNIDAWCRNLVGINMVYQYSTVQSLLKNLTNEPEQHFRRIFSI
jgi:hypothetical protein